jgi:glutaminyl-peptide cyclotransferase
MKYSFLLLLLFSALFFSSCNSCNKPKTDTPVEPVKQVAVNPPAFSADSAYAYTQAQVDFGPRVMNSKSHEQCAAWLISKIKQYADTVYVQKFEVTGWDGTKLQCTNIIASINPKTATRVLLTSHWDSRPWADEDTVGKDKPFASAADGASGVGTLIEVARAMRTKPVSIGVDLFFNDAEDYGKGGNEDSYCIGTQYWGKNPHVPGYKADFGILLDMAATRNAVFAREETSSFNAGWVLDKVWANAASLGYSNYFSNEVFSPITDDHVYINQLTKIPTIDIIHLDHNSRSHTFGDYWHTHADNMDIIDKATLEAVGRTLLYTIYQYDAEQKPQ